MNSKKLKWIGAAAFLGFVAVISLYYVVHTPFRPELAARVPASSRSLDLLPSFLMAVCLSFG